jgi:hypothetical protein
MPRKKRQGPTQLFVELFPPRRVLSDHDNGSLIATPKADAQMIEREHVDLESKDLF